MDILLRFFYLFIPNKTWVLLDMSQDNITILKIIRGYYLEQEVINAFSDSLNIDNPRITKDKFGIIINDNYRIVRLNNKYFKELSEKI